MNRDLFILAAIAGLAALFTRRSGSWLWPLADRGKILSVIGDDRGGRKHQGTDIGVPIGTEVIAVTAGTVRHGTGKGRGGLTVTLETDEGFSVYYAHLSAVYVPDGYRVLPGEVIGLSGDTGNAKGGAPHLHISVSKAGSLYDIREMAS